MTFDDEFRTHLFSYSHDGARWTIEIKARNADDARARIGKLSYATYDGELIAKLPGQAGWLARFSVWLRNVLRT